MSSPLRVLLIDDDEEDAFITEDHLAEAPGQFDLTWVPRYDDGLAKIRDADFDVCLVDYRIGGETGLEFLSRAVQLGVDVPMILLTGVGQHDVDVAASEFGASDFLDKDTLTPVLLERAMRFAVTNARTLRELARQRNVLETTLESIHGGIVAFDASGNLVAANQRFHALMDEIEMPGAPSDAVEVNAVAKGRKLMDSVVAMEREKVVEVEARDNRTYELRCGPVPGGGNVLLAVDVSAQKTLQRNILEAKAAAELANQTKSAFLAKVSHELRTPLNGVIGIAQILKLGDLDEGQTQYVDKLTESAMNLLGLIEDLLDVSIIEQGRFGLTHEPLDVDSLMAEVVDLAQTASPRTDLNISVSVRLPPNLEPVGDGKRIRQILINFLSNAAKFSTNGDIRTSVGLTDARWVKFSVRDDGPGVATADQARVFERFTQADGDVSRSQGGVGLGLSTARELVEQMNGRIGVISNPGAGAEFWFELPLGLERAAPEPMTRRA